MVCGTQRTLSGGTTVTCDDTGANTHGGRHSGLVTFSLFGRVFSSTRIYWETAVTTARTVAQKVAVLGESDFVLPSNQTAIAGGISPNTTVVPPVDPPPVEVPPAYDQTQTFTTSGTFDLAAARAAGATKLDIAVLGAGGTGHSSQFPDPGGDKGAFAAVWTTVTKVIGTDVPVTTNSLTVTVGTAPASPAYLGDGGNGGTSTVAGTGMTSATSTGGVGGSQNGSSTSGKGKGALSKVFNSKTYPGGADVGTGANGTVPGGGGGSGVYFGFGGVGGRGQVMIRAYNT